MAEQASAAATTSVEEKTDAPEGAEAEDKKKRRNKRSSNKRRYHTYISRTLHKRINNDKPMGANRNAARVLENATSAFMDSFIANQCELARLSGHSTVDENVVFTTVKLIVPPEIAPLFIEAAKTAAKTFIDSAAKPATDTAAQVAVAAT
jgi:hypothetical protein